MTTPMTSNGRRYTATGSTGVHNGNRYAVLDRHTSKGGAMVRVSWHKTYKAAQRAAKALNAGTQANDGAQQPRKEGQRSMATKSKKSAGLTNSNARKEQARKAGKCQICGEKTSGFSTVVNYDTGKVSVVKAKEGRAFYCKDHAEKKRKRYEWKIARRAGGTTSTKRKRGAAAKKAAAKPARKRTRKAAAPAKKATTKTAAKAKATPRKRTKKTAAASSADPF